MRKLSLLNALGLRRIPLREGTAREPRENLTPSGPGLHALAPGIAFKLTEAAQGATGGRPMDCMLVPVGLQQVTRP